jgi:hypothetical protein
MTADFQSAARTPSDRRIPASQNHSSSPNAASGNSADHFVPMASPHISPLASRQGRHNSVGPQASGSSRDPGGTTRAIRPRTQSRSATRQLTAQSTKNAMNRSSSASLESTSWSPSKHISRPATRPSIVDRVTRRARRIITSTISATVTAEATRQPKGVIPKTPSPRPMSHFPISGCTTMLGVSVQRPVVRPSRIWSFALST